MIILVQQRKQSCGFFTREAKRRIFQRLKIRKSGISSEGVKSDALLQLSGADGRSSGANVRSAIVVVPGAMMAIIAR